MSGIIEYLPRIIGAFTTFAIGAAVCVVVITLWIFSLSRLPSLSFKSKELSSRLILKTLPLMAGLFIMMPVTVAAITVLGIDGLSDPAAYYLSKTFNPITIVSIGALHLFLTRPRSG